MIHQHKVHDVEEVSLKFFFYKMKSKVCHVYVFINPETHFVAVVAASLLWFVLISISYVKAKFSVHSSSQNSSSLDASILFTNINFQDLSQIRN